MFGPFGSVEFFAILMFFIGFFGLVTANDSLKSIIFTVLMDAGVIMFWVTFGFTEGIVPPIGENIADYLDVLPLADPVPQALMITAIIIGMAVTAINLIMIITLTRKYKSTMWADLKAGHDDNYGEETI